MMLTMMKEKDDEEGAMINLKDINLRYRISIIYIDISLCRAKVSHVMPNTIGWDLI